jgi:N-acetylglucosamine-6-sulfatase
MSERTHARVHAPMHAMTHARTPLRCVASSCVTLHCAAQKKAVKDVGRWNNTYFVVSSDHGYNLGHHRLPSNKFLLYEHATRIPGVVRGPGVQPGNNSVLGTNVDYAPTWLAMAGLPTPATWDGRSVSRGCSSWCACATRSTSMSTY